MNSIHMNMISPIFMKILIVGKPDLLKKYEYHSELNLSAVTI